MRVGGAHIDLLVEHATGINLWEEWARVELADIAGETYSVSAKKNEHAGLLVCLSKDARPEMSSYDAPEIVWRMEKKQHAGLIIASESTDRLETLLAEYYQRFCQEFLAVAPPLESEAQMQENE